MKISIFFEKIISLFFSKEEHLDVDVDPVAPAPIKKESEKKAMVDWSNPKNNISKYFTVHEALWLPSWRTYHIPSEEEKKEIIKLAHKMDIIRERIGMPIFVHVWIRPTYVNQPGHSRHGQNYNLFIGSTATHSAHISGKAIDFHVNSKSGPDGCKEMRDKIQPWLEELDVRMENNKGSWIHIDTKPVTGKRFFNP